jgi:hypothetical protein
MSETLYLAGELSRPLTNEEIDENFRYLNEQFVGTHSKEIQTAEEMNDG